MLGALLAVAGGVVLAWASWRRSDRSRAAAAATSARGVAVFALLVLLLDPAIGTRRREPRPLVLLDRSLSMFASTGHAADAARLAASLGDTVAFGWLAPGIPGGQTQLAPALTAATASGRRLIVVTDGEVADAAEIPADLLAATTVRLVPRTPVADVALTAVRGPVRISARDTLRLEVDGWRSSGERADTASLTVRDSARVVGRGVLHFTGARASVVVPVQLPASDTGAQWLTVSLAAPDDEPDDDVRWWRVEVSRTPAVVVLAATPDFDARALYRALRDVVGVPVRGYVQLRAGVWRRMDDLASVHANAVTLAARGADLLAVRGDPGPWRTAGKARMLWVPGTSPGDWYLRPAGASPVSDAFAAISADSFPAAPAVAAIDTTHAAWIGVRAQLVRRGAAVAVIAGDTGVGGRTVWFGADGLFRWALRGGTTDQSWRTLVAAAAGWLLAAPGGDSADVVVDDAVVERGMPVRFHWASATRPLLPVTFTATGFQRADTLRFDPAGDAQAALPVGRYHFRTARGSGGFGVEPWSNEFIARTPDMRAHVARGGATSPHESWRDRLWLFAIAVIGFAVEWMVRRRAGAGW